LHRGCARVRLGHGKFVWRTKAGCSADDDCEHIRTCSEWPAESCEGYYLPKTYDSDQYLEKYRAIWACSPCSTLGCGGVLTPACWRGRCWQGSAPQEKETCFNSLGDESDCSLCICGVYTAPRSCLEHAGCIDLVQCARLAGCIGTETCDPRSAAFPCGDALARVGGVDSEAAARFVRLNSRMAQSICLAVCGGL
jgi:hypothetical protein